MIKTIIQIGKEISAGRDPWADILAPPKLKASDKKKNLLALPVEFNLDSGEVIVDKTELHEFDNNLKWLRKYRSLELLKGNNKAIYVAIDADKPEQLNKSFFGKQDKQGQYPVEGQFIEAIEKEAPDLTDSQLYKVLKELPKCRKAFLELFSDEKGKISIKSINENFDLPSNHRIVLIYATVTSEAFSLERIPVGNLDGYEAFINAKFFPEPAEEGEKSHKLCYATGEEREDVRLAEFSGRYNINKFFVTTTKNFATSFNSKHYEKNYQLSAEVETYLNRGSDYLLDRAVTDIAGIRHVIIPEFFQGEKIFAKYIKPMVKGADLLFSRRNWDEIYTHLDLVADVDGIYWLNFLAIDSDGNYFKAGDLIKDVSKPHLQRIFDSVKKAGKVFRPWLGGRYGFNLYSVYKSIPVRKDKENVNAALKLFSALLEQRPINRSLLFQHFKEMVLCHRHERYRAYSNITPRNRDYFDFSVKDAVFHYLAFMKVLEELGQLYPLENAKNMEEKQTIDQEVTAFLNAMDYTQDQRALFFLGRVLSQVVYEQTGKKGHKKNALDKLNFNGMDRQSIYRFANELFESGRHYNATDQIKWDWGRFSRAFDLNNWSMDPQEALFYILSGYSYGIKPNKDEENNNDNQN